jgi:3-dehydroquinate synthase
LSLHDKKNKKGKVMFVLLQNIGEARYDVQVEKELILEAFEYYQKIYD